MRWLIALAVLGSWCGAFLVHAEGPQKIKPVMLWTGTDSKHAKEAFARCCTQEEWQTIWQKHSLEKCPEVDFAAYMVVVIFQGKSGHDSGIRFREVVEEMDCIRVRYEPPFGQVVIWPTQDSTGKFTGVKALSDVGEIDWNKVQKNYAFVLLPRSNKAVTVEEDVRRVIANPPEWKERAKFPAIAKR